MENRNREAWNKFAESDFDTVWQLVSGDDRLYCVGYSKGEDNDLVCYQRSGDPERC